MNQEYTDEERGEKLRQWWQSNWRGLVTGVLIALLALFGWRGWQSYQHQQRLDASAQYQTMLSKLEQDQPAAARDMGYGLRDDYANTPYALLASLALAQLELQRQQPEAAKQALRWVMDHADRPAYEELARIRLARLLVATDEAQAALQTLDAIPPESAYTSLAEAVRGDAQRALGELDKARAAYDRALATSQQSSTYLEMKRAELGRVEPAASGEPAAAATP